MLYSFCDSSRAPSSLVLWYLDMQALWLDHAWLAGSVTWSPVTWPISVMCDRVTSATPRSHSQARLEWGWCLACVVLCVYLMADFVISTWAWCQSAALGSVSTTTQCQSDSHAIRSATYGDWPYIGCSCKTNVSIVALSTSPWRHLLAVAVRHSPDVTSPTQRGLSPWRPCHHLCGHLQVWHYPMFYGGTLGLL